MRTEVKVGLVAGVFVIIAALIFLFNKGSDSGQTASIPWNVPAGQPESKSDATAASDAQRSSPRAHATKTGDKTRLTRPAPPSTARPTERPATSGQPPVATARPQRQALPPLASDQRTVATPLAEQRIVAARPPVAGSHTGETAASPSAPIARETPASQPVRWPEAEAGGFMTSGPERASASQPVATLEPQPGQPLRVGPLPRAVPLTPDPSTSLSPVTQPEPAATPPATPGVAVPPRSPDSMREEPAARIRDAAKPKPEPMRYTVQESDTLTYIARQKYGDGKYWTKIRDANPGIDPNHLLVGQVLIIPSKEEVTGTKPATGGASKPGLVEVAKPPAMTEKPAVEAVAARKPHAKATRTYVVASGDTLTTIARNVLGDGSRWRQIYELNRDKIKNPDVLLEGTELKLPDNGLKPPAAAPKPGDGAKKTAPKPRP